MLNGGYKRDVKVALVTYSSSRKKLGTYASLRPPRKLREYTQVSQVC